MTNTLNLTKKQTEELLYVVEDCGGSSEKMLFTGNYNVRMLHVLAKHSLVAFTSGGKYFFVKPKGLALAKELN